MIKIDPSNPKGIVWLASYPKSGNTWLRIFLYHLVRIQSGHPREAKELNNLERVSQWEVKRRDLFEKFLGKPLIEAAPLEVMQVRSRVQAAIADEAPSVCLVKTHNMYGYIGGLPIINSSVSVGGVYMVRDPRDVAQSLAGHLDSSIDDAIEVMNKETVVPSDSLAAFEVWGTWSQNIRTWTSNPDPALLVIRYEDMTEKPAQVFASVVRHLGQGATTPKQIAEAIELSSFDKAQREEDAHGFPGRPPQAKRFFATGKVGTWQQRLSAAQVRRISEVHGPVMERLGYR